MQATTLQEVSLVAAKIRRWSLEEVYLAQSGHMGGSLSIAELLAVLYWQEMNVDPNNPTMENRDRFVLSKGHCSPAVYAALAMKGYFPLEALKTFRNIDSFLSGHVKMVDVPGVDMSTGSLGQGLSAAVGMALAAKMDQMDYRVYCIVGDGELQEGQIWEACMFAPHFKLDNLVLILDNNNLQISGTVDSVLSPYPIVDKFTAFGFHVVETDGHDPASIKTAFAEARTVKGKPTAIIARTVKGKGVDFMENIPSWHGTPPNKEQYESAAAQLDAAVVQWEREGA